jgi:multiple sugar transport system ATP-binding protein
MARVEFRNVSKVYGQGRRALTSISLEIHDGEFLVLVGPSGCGKSTLLRTLAGLEEPTDGEVWIGDRLVNGVPPKDRDIAMVFQNYALYPHMTAYDNIAFALKIRRVARHEVEARVRRAATILGIEPLLGKMPRALSGGERQRVALGRAIVRDPRVFLFDEPLSNLDAKLRSEMRAEISALHRRLGVTTVYVTHDQVEAMTMGQRIVVLRDGEVQQAGRPLTIYREPANLFVAGFIGSPSMNFLDCGVESDGAAVRIDDMRLPLQGSFPPALRPYAGRTVTLGIRPEDVRIDSAEGLPARVSLVEPTGGEAYVHADAGGRRVVVRVPGASAAAAGDAIRLRVDPRRAHFFDAGTGYRIATPPVGDVAR